MVKVLDSEREHYLRHPRYTGLTFESIQNVLERMVGYLPLDWHDLYSDANARVTPNIDKQHLMRTGFTHYLWRFGWQNVDEIIRERGVADPNIKGRRPGSLRVLRHADSDDIVEIDVDYRMPDLNERGYKESMYVLFRRFKDEEKGVHRLIIRTVSECSEVGGVMYSELGGGAGIGNDLGMSDEWIKEGWHLLGNGPGLRWDKPRYIKAFEELVYLLKVSRI